VVQTEILHTTFINFIFKRVNGLFFTEAISSLVICGRQRVEFYELKKRAVHFFKMVMFVRSMAKGMPADRICLFRMLDG
jgi:hypothetical protein